MKHCLFCFAADSSGICQGLIWVLPVIFIAAAPANEPALAEQTANPIVVNDDGAWCWFQDERALIHGTTLLVGSVANGSIDAARHGDIELIAFDLASGRLTRTELHDQLDADDHAAPALLLRPDGRLLAVYSKHESENCYYSRLTRLPGDFTDWLPEMKFVPSDTSRITYSNLHFLSGENNGRGRLYNFVHGLDASFKPSCAFSDDLGGAWQTGNVVIDVPLAFCHRPYAKYASNGRDTIHIVYTVGHPRDYDNSVYHVFYRHGQLHRSDGTVFAPLTDGLKCPSDGARLFWRGPVRTLPRSTHRMALARGELTTMCECVRARGKGA